MNDKAASINRTWEIIFDRLKEAQEWVNENLMEDITALAHLHFNESDALYLIEEFRIKAKSYVAPRPHLQTGTPFCFNHTTTGIELKLADEIVVRVSIENKDKPRKLAEDMTDDEFDEAKNELLEYLLTWVGQGTN